MSGTAASCTLELSNGRFIHIAVSPEDAERATAPDRWATSPYAHFPTQDQKVYGKKVRVRRSAVIAIHALDKESAPGNQNAMQVEIMRPSEITQKVLSSIRNWSLS